MTKTLEHFVTLNNKKYAYSLAKASAASTFVLCEAANIAQEFANDDIPELLIDLPNLIFAEKAYVKKQEEVIRFRISAEEKKLIEQKALQKGYSSVSGFLRDLALGKS